MRACLVRTTALAVLTGVLMATGGRAQDVMYRGGPEHTGAYAGRGVLSFGGLQWRLQTGGPVRSTPVVSQGVVYVGSSDGGLYAIDETTGKVRWRHDAGSPILSSPAVSGRRGLVVFGAASGEFLAVRVTDGRLAWRFRPGATVPLVWGYESGQIYTSSPTLSGDRVAFGGLDGGVYLVDLATGRQRWRIDTGARVVAAPAVSGGLVVVGNQAGLVLGVDLATGRERWRYATAGDSLHSGDWGFDRTTVQASPSISDGTVYVGARDGFLYALDAGSGTLRWQVDHQISWVNSAPAVSGGLVFAGSSDKRFVQAVEAGSGEERWRAAVGSVVWASPAVAGDLVYVGDGTGTLYALDRTTGKEVWQYRVGGKIFSSVVVDGSRLFFGSDDGGVYAVNSAGGTPLRRAVFWDSTYIDWPLGNSSTELRDYLAERGYQRLDAAGLVGFMADRLRDRAAAAVVFAIDQVPASVAPLPADTVLFRRFLDAGNTVVWFGSPPFLAPRDAKSLKDLDRDAAGRLLGVRMDHGNFDRLGVRVTDPGRQLGLPEWWLDAWAADPGDVSVVFGTDEQGRAAAWRKSYGGPAGTGFIRLVMGDGTAGRPLLPWVFQAAAELRMVSSPDR